MEPSFSAAKTVTLRERIMVNTIRTDKNFFTVIFLSKNNFDFYLESDRRIR
jgi:hypothetical protein